MQTLASPVEEASSVTESVKRSSTKQAWLWNTSTDLKQAQLGGTCVQEHIASMP